MTVYPYLPLGRVQWLKSPLNELWLSYGHGKLPTQQSNVEDYTGTQKKTGFVSQKFPKSRLEGHCQHRFWKKKKKKHPAFKSKD